MRDLIRNYKMIIQGKNENSDSETESLLTSTSSSVTQSFGTMKETTFFKQESSSAESGDDRKRQTETGQNSAALSIQNAIKRPFLQQSHSFSGLDTCGLMMSAQTHGHPYHPIPSEKLTFTS